MWDQQFALVILWLLTSSLGKINTNSLYSLTSVRPSIKRSESDSDDVVVIKGADVTLQCAAEGTPRPAVTWLKDGRPITGQRGAKVLNEGRLLQIKDAKVSDTGRYTCIAVNVAGQADSKHDVSVHGMNHLLFWAVSFKEPRSGSECDIFFLFQFPHHLSVLVPPSIIGQVEEPENVSVVVKNPVALSCEASGIPLPSITWLKDGQPIKTSSSVRILSGECLF